jgi:hypothetical protein
MSPDDYQWVGSMSTGASHAITTRLTHGVRTYLVCGRNLNTERIVASLPGAHRCGNCINGIENGTGWA